MQCPRCGYDREADEQRKQARGHFYHRLRIMLLVVLPDESRLWICERCQIPGERVETIEQATARPLEVSVADGD